MTSIVEIQSPNYKIESSNILQYDTISSRYYLNRTVNKNLQVIGNNIVLEGLKINYYPQDTKYFFEISPGKVICDLCLIDIDTTSILSLETSYLDGLSEIVIMMNYRYSEESLNSIQLKLYHIHSGLIFPDNFNINSDNILIAHFYFENELLKQSNSTVKSNKKIDIKGRIYDIYPISNLFKQQLDYIDKLQLLYNYNQ